MKIWTSNYFYGNEVSLYGKQCGYVDYRTLAKAFNHVFITGSIFNLEMDAWEQVNGLIDNSERIEELEDQLEEIELLITSDSTEEQDAATEEQIRDIEEELRELRDEESFPAEIFQYYIVDDNGADILKEFTNNPLFYNEELDMYIWGVTHCGTGWDYVLTDIKIEIPEEA